MVVESIDLLEHFDALIKHSSDFMKAHNIKVTGEKLYTKTSVLVFTEPMLIEFQKILQEAEDEMRKVRLMAAKKADNPFQVPEKSSLSDDSAYYFPFGEA